VSTDAVRAEWERAYAEIETQREDARRYRRRLAAFEVVTAELRLRVGQTFSLRDLVDAYADADRWTRAAVSEQAPYEGWPRDLALVTDAAFHAYARRAVDFEP
jgi:hypothetical protein